MAELIATQPESEYVFHHFQSIAIIIFTKNNNGKNFKAINYLQAMKCAMSLTCAPLYAEIFVAKFEETYINPYIKKALLYLR